MMPTHAEAVLTRSSASRQPAATDPSDGLDRLGLAIGTTTGDVVVADIAAGEVM